MENASKALIIAGSILLAILIIALGMTIFNNAKNAANTEALDSAEINMFNQKFEKFSTGNNSTIMGSQVKTLLSSAISNASTNKDEPIKLPTIKLLNEPSYTSGQDAQGDMTANTNIQAYIGVISNMKNNITSTGNYKVLCDYGATSLITTITIERK